MPMEEKKTDFTLSIDGREIVLPERFVTPKAVTPEDDGSPLLTLDPPRTYRGKKRKRSPTLADMTQFPIADALTQPLTDSGIAGAMGVFGNEPGVNWNTLIGVGVAGVIGALVSNFKK